MSALLLIKEEIESDRLEEWIPTWMQKLLCKQVNEWMTNKLDCPGQVRNKELSKKPLYPQSSSNLPCAIKFGVISQHPESSTFELRVLT